MSRPERQGPPRQGPRVALQERTSSAGQERAGAVRQQLRPRPRDRLQAKRLARPRQNQITRRKCLESPRTARWRPEPRLKEKIASRAGEPFLLELYRDGLRLLSAPAQQSPFPRAGA